MGTMQYSTVEQTERNKEIYCKKLGLKDVTDKKPTLKPKTYRELMGEYNLSIQRLLYIVNVGRKKYGKK